MDTASKYGSVENTTKEIERMEKEMVMEKKNKKTDRSIEENTWIMTSMDRDIRFGKMDLVIEVHLTRIWWMAGVNIYGPMEDPTSGNELLIKWKAKAFKRGQMDELSLVNSTMIKKAQGMVSTHGQMEENTEDGGKMVCNMDMANNSVYENRNGLQENGKEEEE